jgi:hypothetical protein
LTHGTPTGWLAGNAAAAALLGMLVLAMLWVLRKRNVSAKATK